MATYRTCVADANTQKQELEDTKVNSLRQIHEVIKQTDQVIKSVSGAGLGCPQGRRWLCPALESSELPSSRAAPIPDGVWVDAELPSPSCSKKHHLVLLISHLTWITRLTSVPLHITSRPPSPSTS